MSNELRDWRNYIDQLDGRSPDAKMATFHARYKFAYNFQSIVVRDMASGTLDTYSLVTKISFSYSALENLEKTLNIKHQPAIAAKDLAEKVRKRMPDAMSRLENRMYVNDGLRARLEHFFGPNDSSDVRPVIEHFRHSLFHGKFTPNGWGLLAGIETLELLEGLSQVTMRKADETFTSWFQSQHH